MAEAETFASKSVVALFDHPGPNLRYSFFFPPENESNRAKEQQHARNLERLRTASHEGLSMEYTRNKGWGIRAVRKFLAGDLVLRYCGTLMSRKEGLKVEASLKEAEIDDSFLFFFKLDSRELCLDATRDDGSYGRLVNHSRLRPNCEPVGIMDGRTPALALCALRDIMIGEEVLYDYGDIDESTIAQNPWLEQS